MNVLEDAIATFLNVLRSSWADVKRALVNSAGWDDSVVYDWAQANWEQIVEAALSRERERDFVLEVYGAGADVNESSSRVWKPSKMPTHEVACIPRVDGNAVVDKLSQSLVALPPRGLLLVEFVTMNDGWYEAHSPFDHALLRRKGGDVVVALIELSFILNAAGSGEGVRI